MKIRFVSVLCSCWLALMEISVAPMKLEAAESVILRYRILTESISVLELSQFVRKDKLSPRLRAYLDMADTDPKELKRILNKEIKVDGVRLYKFLKSLPGEMLLNQASKIITTPSQRASRESLRAALVSSALPDGKIALIEVMENYPTSQVDVEGDRLAEMYNHLSGVTDIADLLGL